MTTTLNLDNAALTEHVTAIRKSSWRDILPIHPAADFFPLMSSDELRVLGEDIKKNSLQVPIAIKSAKDASGWQYWLLDGRNRLDAMEVVGIPARLELIKGQCSVIMHADTDHDFSDAYVIESDPYDYVISANIRRRHLSAEQRQDVLVKLIARAPKKSDRQIAKEVGVDHKTIAKARAKGEDVGSIPHVSTRTDTKGREQPAEKKSGSRSPQSPSRHKVVTRHEATAGWAAWSVDDRQRFIDGIGSRELAAAIPPHWTMMLVPAGATMGDIGDRHKRIAELEAEVGRLQAEVRKLRLGARDVGNEDGLDIPGFMQRTPASTTLNRDASGHHDEVVNGTALDIIAKG